MHSLQVEVLPSGLLQENPRVLSQPFWLLLRFLKSFFFFQRYHFPQPSTLTINETRTIFFLKSTIALDSPLIITPKRSPANCYLSFSSSFPSRLSRSPLLLIPLLCYNWDNCNESRSIQAENEIEINSFKLVIFWIQLTWKQKGNTWFTKFFIKKQKTVAHVVKQHAHFT